MSHLDPANDPDERLKALWALSRACWRRKPKRPLRMSLTDAVMACYDQGILTTGRAVAAALAEPCRLPDGSWLELAGGRDGETVVVFTPAAALRASWP